MRGTWNSEPVPDAEDLELWEWHHNYRDCWHCFQQFEWANDVVDGYGNFSNLHDMQETRDMHEHEEH